jgi:hypothetical protein
MALRSRHDGILALTLAVGACASHPPETCRPGERPTVVDALYFGTAKPDGTVTAAEWRDFMDRVVTPGFPRDRSWWASTGQCQRRNAVVLDFRKKNKSPVAPGLHRLKTKRASFRWPFRFVWRARPDSNGRPLASEANTLSN